MELRQFEYFAAIVRDGSFSRAARTLHVSQPALSKQIQSLEHELGVVLLDRVPKGVRPTDAGRRLAEMCDVIVGYVEQIKPAVRAASHELGGNVTLGLSPSLVPALAEHVHASLAALHPGLHVQIVESLPMFVTDWIDAGRIDVGVFRRWPALSGMTRLDCADIGSDEVMLVGTPSMLRGHPRPTASAEDVASLPIVTTPAFKQLVWTRLGLTDTSTTSSSEIDSINLIKALVVRGDYCSAMPWNFVRHEISAGLLEARPFEPSVRSHIVSATRAGRRASSPAIAAVIEVCRDRLNELATRRLGPHSLYSDPEPLDSIGDQ